MATTLSDVLTLARTYLNDDNANQFSDPVLIPKSKIAHQEMQTKLWVNGSPIVRGQSAEITIPSSGSITDVTNLNPTGFPSDMLLPSGIYESAIGGASWVPVTEQIYFPIGYTAGARIGLWSFQQEHLLLAPCTASNIIVIQYRKSIPIPNIATDPIGVLFGDLYLAARTASIAAASVGNEAVADKMQAMAKENFANLLVANRGQQKAMVSTGMGYTGVPNSA